jgi:DNA-binding transcriptional LysR family regulator
VVFRKLEDACAAVEQTHDLRAGHLELGVVPAVHLAWVPPALARMTAAFPGVTIAVHERAAHQVETEVEAGRYDLGLGMVYYASPNVRFERLLVEGIALICPAAHPLAKRSSLEVKELIDTPLVLMPESFDLRHAIDAVLRRARVRPRVVCEINTIDATLATVVEAGLPTLLPRVVLVGRKPQGLKAVRVAGKGGGSAFEFGLFWPRDVEPSPPAREFARILRASRARS